MDQGAAGDGPYRCSSSTVRSSRAPRHARGARQHGQVHHEQLVMILDGKRASPHHQPTMSPVYQKRFSAHLGIPDGLTYRGPDGADICSMKLEDMADVVRRLPRALIRRSSSTTSGSPGTRPTTALFRAPARHLRRRDVAQRQLDELGSGAALDRRDRSRRKGSKILRPTCSSGCGCRPRPSG